MNFLHFEKFDCDTVLTHLIRKDNYNESGRPMNYLHLSEPRTPHGVSDRVDVSVSWPGLLLRKPTGGGTLGGSLRAASGSSTTRTLTNSG